MTVAALYIDPRGPYPKLARDPDDLWDAPLLVDCWDASRDARTYEGPHPIVAHPPCKHWSRLRHLALWTCASCKRSCRHCDTLGDPDELPACPECGGELTGDWDCALRAVEQVRRWGGVLEHPAGSLLWKHDHCRLPEPSVLKSDYSFGSGPIDAFGGYTIEVDQCELGHVARKCTWLYLVGVPLEALEAPPFPGREPTHRTRGGRSKAGKKSKSTPVPPGIKVCSAQQRGRTPPLFAEYLVRLARSVKR